MVQIYVYPHLSSQAYLRGSNNCGKWLHSVFKFSLFLTARKYTVISCAGQFYQMAFILVFFVYLSNTKSCCPYEPKIQIKLDSFHPSNLDLNEIFVAADITTPMNCKLLLEQ